MNIGKAIKLCRTQRSLNQNELSSLAGISPSYLSMLERGKRDPNLSTVQQIADGLNIPVSILVFLAADEEEISSISPALQEKLSLTALKLIQHSNEPA